MASPSAQTLCAQKKFASPVPVVSGNPANHRSETAMKTTATRSRLRRKTGGTTSRNAGTACRGVRFCSPKTTPSITAIAMIPVQPGMIWLANPFSRITSHATSCGWWPSAVIRSNASVTVTAMSPSRKTGTRANGTQIMVAIAAVRVSRSTTGSSRMSRSAVMARNGRERRASAGYRKLASRRNAGSSDQRLSTMQAQPAIAVNFRYRPAKKKERNAMNAAMTRRSLMVVPEFLIPGRRAR